MKQHTSLRELLDPLKKTPLHPQWFIYKEENKLSKEISGLAYGCVLDIGAGTQAIKHFLSSNCEYFSLDYYQTATEWYHTQPQLFGDGQRLPIRSNSIDTVLLLDVIEHIPKPHDCIAEIMRVLKPGGMLIINVPFLYPLHDEPYDFHRWTKYGLREMAYQHDFQIDLETHHGHPVETAALLANLASSQTTLNWLQRKNPLFVLSVFLPFFILFCNISAWLILHLSKDNDFMPNSYFVVWSKTI